MICNELEKMTSAQAISNLFEMKESLGPKHTNKVANLIIDKMLNDGSLDEGGLPRGQQKMFVDIAAFVGVDPFPDDEE
jgi:hypothetical protein